MKKRDLLTMLLLIPTKKEENTPFLLGASIVITTVILIGALLESTFIFGLGVLGIIVAPFIQVFFRDNL